ncbi:MAG: sulfurtransferase [Pseudomonadota bacterium]
MITASPLISAADAFVNRDRIAFIDSTWFLDGSSGYETYQREHIPSAHFFDLDAIADQESSLPHMMPTPEQFSEAVGPMIGDSEHVVIYDASPLHSAARVWWTFRTMGFAGVQVLDGGLHAWKERGFPVTREEPQTRAGTFRASWHPEKVIDFRAMTAALETREFCIVDARPAGRFQGIAPEPRAGLPSGAMPNAINVPMTELYQANGKLQPSDRLREIFEPLQRERDQRIVATCGSGVTACSILLALSVLGYENLALYDGSWAEWAMRSNAIIPAPA